MQKFHVKRGDLVVVIAGAHKGKSGKVLNLLPAKSRAVVEGVAMIKKHLKKIILDDPRLSSKPSKIDYYSMAYGALQLSMTEGKISAPIGKRKCPNGCTCQVEYSTNLDRSKEMYAPKIY